MAVEEEEKAEEEVKVEARCVGVVVAVTASSRATAVDDEVADDAEDEGGCGAPPIPAFFCLERVACRVVT